MSVFDSEKTVFFKMDGGGVDDDSSGCLQSWWDAEVAANGVAATMLKLMDADGTPIVSDGVDYDVGTDRFELTGAAAAGVEVGMLVRVYDVQEKMEFGFYEISVVGTDYFKCVDIDWNGGAGDDTVQICIGGAFETMQEVLDETDASNYSVTLYTTGIDLGGSALVLDGGGDADNNSFLRLVGFNTVPGDMNYGGAYYESPLEILQSGAIDADKTVLLSYGAGSQPIISIIADNIILENFHSSGSTSGTAIAYTGIPKNIVFRNFRVSNSWNVVAHEADGVLFDSCYTDTLSQVFFVPGGDITLLGCIGEVAATRNYLYLSGGMGTIIGCISIGGDRGILVVGADGEAVVLNNSFYDCSIAGVQVSTGGSAVVVNNIFNLAVGAVGLYQNLGSFSYNDYNCYIEVDGTPLTAMYTVGRDAPLIGAHSIEAAPLFVDAANGDFRLQPGSPCLNTGRQRMPNGYSSMGAWQALGGSRPQVRRK